MDWKFPYVSTYDTDFAFDFGLALTEEQAQEIPQLKELIENPPDWLQEWAGQVEPAEGRAAREPELDRVCPRERHRLPHLHRVGARPVRRAVFSFLLDRTPKPQPPRRALAEGRVPGLMPCGRE